MVRSIDSSITDVLVGMRWSPTSGAGRRNDSLPSIKVRLRKNTGQQSYAVLMRSLLTLKVLADPVICQFYRFALRSYHVTVTVPANSCLVIETKARIPFLMVAIHDPRLEPLTADMGSSLFVRGQFRYYDFIIPTSFLEPAH